MSRALPAFVALALLIVTPLFAGLAAADPFPTVTDHGPLAAATWAQNLTTATGPTSGPAAHFNDLAGPSVWVQTNHTTSTEFVGGSGTLAAWINLADIGSNDSYIAYRHGNGNPMLAVDVAFFVRSNGSVTCQYKSSSATVTTLTTAPRIQPNTWYHVACTISGTTATYYENGTLVGSTVGTSSGIATSTCPFEFGMRLNLNTGCGGGLNRDGPIIGNMDDVRIYTGALTGSRIAAIYAGTAYSQESDMMLWYHFDEAPAPLTISAWPVLGGIDATWPSISYSTNYGLWYATLSSLGAACPVTSADMNTTTWTNAAYTSSLAYQLRYPRINYGPAAYCLAVQAIYGAGGPVAATGAMRANPANVTNVSYTVGPTWANVSWQSVGDNLSSFNITQDHAASFNVTAPPQRMWFNATWLNPGNDYAFNVSASGYTWGARDGNVTRITLRTLEATTPRESYSAYGNLSRVVPDPFDVALTRKLGSVAHDTVVELMRYDPSYSTLTVVWGPTNWATEIPSLSVKYPASASTSDDVGGYFLAVASTTGTLEAYWNLTMNAQWSQTYTHTNDPPRLSTSQEAQVGTAVAGDARAQAQQSAMRLDHFGEGTDLFVIVVGLILFFMAAAAIGGILAAIR